MKRCSAFLASFLLTVLSACTYVHDKSSSDSLDNLKIMSEFSDVKLLSKETTNWIPGNLFPTEYGYEELDYVVFSQSGVLTLDPLCIQSSMVPDEYQSTDGVAPERSFKIIIKPEDCSYSQEEGNISFGINNSNAEVEFQSGYNCIMIPNTQAASLSISGNVEPVDTIAGMIRYVGDVVVVIALQGGDNLTLRFTELFCSPGL